MKEPNKLRRLLKKFYLKKIKRYESIDGWLNEDEAYILFEIARKLPNNSLSVEIGSWKGRSTFCIAKGIKKGELIVIDPFNASGGLDVESELNYKSRSENIELLEIFKSNMKRLNVLNKIIIKKGYSYEFDSQVENIDFLFIDGDHSIEGCKRDFNLYHHKIKRGGFIAFHDYYESREELGPTHVIHNILMESKEFSFYGLYGSIWVGQRR